MTSSIGALRMLGDNRPAKVRYLESHAEYLRESLLVWI